MLFPGTRRDGIIQAFSSCMLFDSFISFFYVEVIKKHSTIDVYGHLYPNKQKEMADKLDALL